MFDHEDKERGLYEKYRVTRRDGKGGRGQKHHKCRYFVLDLTHDPHAIAALYGYAESCEVEFPQLADELRDYADSIHERCEACRRVHLEDDQTVWPHDEEGIALCPPCAAELQAEEEAAGG